MQINRTLSAQTKIWAADLKHGRFLDSPDLVAKVQDAGKVIDQSGAKFIAGSMSASRLISRVNYLHNTQGVDTFLFDRLELIDVTEYSKDIETGRGMLMERLRTLCVDLDIIIVMAAQLRKSYESRPMCQPEIVDVKGNSAIVDSATHLFMLTRPEYHGIMEDADGNPTKGKGKVMLLKNTEGELVDVSCRFIGELALWAELDNDVDDFGPADPYGQVSVSYNEEIVEF